MKNLKKVILFNPRSAKYNQRIPNSILQLAAAIEGKYEYVLVDGNRESDSWEKIRFNLDSNEFSYFACTTMPALQLKQAISYSKKIRQLYPRICIIWGGYFASNQFETVLRSAFVDYVVSGPGDVAFPSLLDALEINGKVDHIQNLIYQEGADIIVNPKEPLLDQDLLPTIPYHKLDKFYTIDGYLGNTFLGKKTIAYHSSMGCPFSCSFCAVVPIYNAKWRGKSAVNIYNDIVHLKNSYGGDAIEFHDNNFFVSEKRVVEFADLIAKEKMIWWGEARIDTMNKYSDHSLIKIRKSGCKMIFFGAETGNDSTLKRMNKGGTLDGEQIREFARRLAQFDIIPEYSFVLGTPADSPEAVWEQIEQDISFIREIKEINPKTEIIIYVYSPVPTKGSELYENVVDQGFKFPKKLEDWINPRWEKFDMRKNPMTPWLTAKMVDRILNFETVLNAYYPTLSDIKLTKIQRKVMRLLSYLRYRLKIYRWPYELRFLQSRWLKYRQPEIEGF
jgi:radical SAM superfamily enzyme YgiQ (UPF0313 family)